MKVLLAGCGIWGRNILKRLRDSGCEVHVCDPDSAACSSAMEAGAASVFPQVGDGVSLHHIQAAVVATPAVTHADVVYKLLSSLPPTAPILCEKPLAVSTHDAAGMVAAAGGRLFVGHIWRYHPGITRLGELVRAGALGRVHGVRSTRANWTSPRTDVDSIWNLVPHDITLAIEILGQIPVPHSATVDLQQGRPCGMVGVLGRDPWVIFESSNRYADKRREVRVHGEEGVAVLPAVDASEIEIARSGRDGSLVLERMPLPPGDPLTLQLRAFLDFANGNGAAPKSPAEEGLAVVRTVERLRALAGLGEPP
jgi:predicted dehydrogenase